MTTIEEMKQELQKISEEDYKGELKIEMLIDEKNKLIKKLKKEVKENKIKMELDKESIESMQKDICDLNGGFQVCKTSIINIMNNFNAQFPDYAIPNEE